MMKKQQSIYELNRIQQYIMQMRPILRKRALFSDGTEDYRSPAEPKAGGAGDHSFSYSKR